MTTITHCETNAVLYKDAAKTPAATVESAVAAHISLADAYLTGVRDVIAAGYPDDWPAFGWHRAGVIQVRVGCRTMSPAEGRAYWASKDNRREVLAALDYIETVARLRGWIS